jgi:septal ring factor EnvC (AmiA/AmiB activator)
LNKRHYGTENINELVVDYNKMLDGYLKDSVGTDRNKTLCESLKLLQYNVFQSIADSVSTEADKEIRQHTKRKANLDEKSKEYEARLKNLDQRMANLEHDEQRVEDDERDLDKKNREIDSALQESSSKAQEYK